MLIYDICTFNDKCASILVVVYWFCVLYCDFEVLETCFKLVFDGTWLFHGDFEVIILLMRRERFYDELNYIGR